MDDRAIKINGEIYGRSPVGEWVRGLRAANEVTLRYLKALAPTGTQGSDRGDLASVVRYIKGER